MEGIFDLSSILWHVLNAAILFVALYFLLYKPVRKFMQKRADGVSAQLDEAARKEKDADALLEQSHGALSSAQREAAETVSQSARQAQKRADEILSTANAKAEEIVRRANEEAEQIRQNAHEAMVDESAKLAVLIASKLLEREVSLEDHKRLIDEFLEKVG